MFVVAIAAGAILTFVVCLLAVPMVVVVDVDETSRLRWRVSWLHGLLTLRSGTGKAARSSSRSPVPVHREPRGANRRKERGRAALAVFGTRGVHRRVTRLVLSLLKRVKVERLHVDAAFGFENPADTGVVFGSLSPLFVFAQTRGLDVHCRPMFWEEGVRGSLGATLHIRPLQVVGTVGAFVISPPILRAMRAAWHAKN